MTDHTEIIDSAHFEKQYQFEPPHELLSELVEFYWQLDLSAETAIVDFTDSILANLNTSVVFNLGSAFDLIHKKTGTPERIKQSVIIGHHTHQLQYKHYSGNFLFGIKLRPAGFNMMFGISSAELNNRFVDTGEFFKHLFIEERLTDCRGIHDRSVLMNNILIGLLGAGTANHKILYIHRALSEIVILNNVFNVDHLAESLNLTKRTLERYFKEETGLTPKTCISIIRFREALKKMNQAGSLYLPEDLGYYDLSHFMKDFHRFAESKK